MGRSKTTTEERHPYAPAVPHLMRAQGDLANMYDAGTLAPNPYPGPRVADFGQNMQNALAGAAQGYAGIGPGMSALTGMMGNDNIYAGLGNVRNEIMENAKAALGSTFTGPTGGLPQMESERAMVQALAPFEYGAWGDAQQRQLAAANAAVPYAQLALQGGGLELMNAQQRLDAQKAYYDEMEDTDYNALQRYALGANQLAAQGGWGKSVQPGNLLGDIGSIAGGIGAGLSGLGTAGIIGGAAAGAVT